jgi:hypothetical protein
VASRLGLVFFLFLGFLFFFFRFQAFFFHFSEGVHAEAFLFGLVAFLDDVRASEMDFLIDIFGDDVVPVGEAAVEFFDLVLRLFDFLVVLVLLALVVLEDALPFGVGRLRLFLLFRLFGFFLALFAGLFG